MICKKGFMLVLLLVLLSFSVNGQTVKEGDFTSNRVELKTPSGIAIGEAECVGKEFCTISIEGICYEEGQYKTKFFTTHLDEPLETDNEIVAYTVNWDTQKYCQLVCVGTEVDYASAAGACCGDDVDDCGLNLNNLACGDPGGNWEWFTPGEDVGVIKNFNCGPISVVVTQTEALLCSPDNNFVTETITGDDGKEREYYCYNTAIANDEGIILESFINECAATAIPESNSPDAKSAGGKIFTNTEFAIIPSIKGDLDGDEKITLTDLRIAEWMLETGHKLETICAVDMNNDGNFDNSDIVQITNLIGETTGEKCFDNEKNRLQNVKYCNNDNTWIEELDVIDARLACVNAEGENYKWTGTRCCQEPEDFEEFYNDPYVQQIFEFDGGGCWNSSYVVLGGIAQGTNNTIANFNGTFYGCGIKPEKKMKYDPKSIINETNNLPECSQFVDIQTDQYLLCQANGKWSVSAEILQIEKKTTENLTDASTLLEQGGVANGCCDINSCWDGFNCVDNQILSATYNPSYNCEGDSCFRCLDGKWQQTRVKHKWDNSGTGGYCPLDTQCLVNPIGLQSQNNNTEAYFTNQKPQCVNDGQYITDFLCEQGNWSTRTKLIAAQMLDFANTKPEFTFFCDNFRDALAVLPSTQGDLFMNCQIGDEQVDCINTICLLQYEGKVGIGASLNHPINGTKSFLQVLGEPVSSCDGVNLLSENFVKCGSSPVYYNPSLNSVIFLDDPLLPPSPSIAQAVLKFIKNPFEIIRTKIFSVANIPEEYDFFNNTRIFNKIYASKTADKEIFAFFEQGQYEGPIVRDYIGLRYDGLDFDTCEIVQNYDFLATCTQEGNDFTIVRQRLPTEKSTLIDAWKDITSKLRPQNGQ